MAEEEVVAAAEPKAPSSGGLKSLFPTVAKALLIVILVLTASAGGGVVSWALISRSGVLPMAAEAEEHEVADEAEAIRHLMENGAVVDLEPFVVNLADTDSPRYLRVTVSLLVDDKTIVAEVIENAAVVSKTRDIILQTLSRKRSNEIIDEEGKNHLRAEILEGLEPYFHEPKVVDVMFTEFVIQL